MEENPINNENNSSGTDEKEISSKEEANKDYSEGLIDSASRGQEEKNREDSYKEQLSQESKEPEEVIGPTPERNLEELGLTKEQEENNKEYKKGLEETASKEVYENELEREQAWNEANLEQELSDEDVEKNHEKEIQEASDQAKVTPLDPDFILILIFAVIVDSLDIVIFILGFLDLFTITSAISILIDIIVSFIIGGWIYSRTNRIMQSKKQRIEALNKKAQQLYNRMSQMNKMGKVSDKALERYGKRFGKQAAVGKKLIARMAKTPIIRTLTRTGITLLGEMGGLEFLGIIPFWTISVVTVLKEK